MAETKSTSPLEPASESAEVGVARATKDPTPAHIVSTAGPRSTPNPSISSPAVIDPHTPETSLYPQETEAVMTRSQFNGWEAPLSSKAPSEIQPSSEKAKDSSIQDPFKDGSFISVTNTEIPQKTSDTHHMSRDPSGEDFGTKSASFSNVVVTDSLPTREVGYQAGAAGPLAAATRNPSSDDSHDPIQIPPDLNKSPSHGSLTQLSSDPKGTSTAEPGLSRPESHFKSGILPESPNHAEQTKGSTDGYSTHVIADPSADPIAVANTASNRDVGPSVGSSIDPTLHNSPHSPFPSDQGEQRPQNMSPTSSPVRRMTSPTIAASRISSETKPDSLISGGLAELTLRTKEGVLTSDVSIATKRDSKSQPGSLNPSLAFTVTYSKSSISDLDAHEASASASIIASKEPFKTSSDALPQLSVSRSGLHFELADGTTLNDPQSKPSESIRAVLSNQTTPAFDPSGTSAAGKWVRASSTSKNLGGNNTVLPYQSGDQRKAALCPIRFFICLASFLFVFLD